MIIGPVGCGKSTLLKAILGEITVSNGIIEVASLDIAYCDQTPWIINGTLRDNVIAFSSFESKWYNTVIHACALDVDIAYLPDGDSSNLGSKGLTLSGG